MARNHVGSTMRALAGALMLAVMAACGDGATAPARTVAQVLVTPVARELVVGQTLTVQATPLAADGTPLEGREVTWRSDASDVATVSAQGVVEARRVGAATIVATSEGKEGRAAITIVVAPVASVQLDDDELSMLEFQAQRVIATPRDAQGNALPDRTVEWWSANTEVATVSATGVVSAVGPGVTYITAASGGRSARADVTVVPAPVAVVQLESSELGLEEGAARRLTATVRDAEGRVLTGRTVRWTSSDPAVVQIDATGTVVALRWGTAVIEASAGGRTARATLAVSAPMAYDLAYHARTGYLNQPQLYRVDVRAPGAAPVRIADLTGMSEITPSPDGTRIAFTGTDGFGTEIFVADRDGSNVRALTSGTANADQPAWSPDGQRIAFRRWPAGGPPGPFNPADIWVMNADGSAQANLTADAGDAGSMAAPTWSPRLGDGTMRIAYSRQVLADGYQAGRVYTMRADGADKRAVTAAGSQLDDEPTWSPDGRTIVFVRTGGEAMGDLWALDVASGAARQLMASDPPFDQRSPAWSPDGRFVAFTSNHELGTNNRWDYQIYTVTADGRTIVRRTEGTEKEHPAWIARP